MNNFWHSFFKFSNYNYKINYINCDANSFILINNNLKA